LKDLLLITPPFTQLNTPYPATAYIKGFLNTKNISSFQTDLGIEVILKLFSKDGLQKIFNQKIDLHTISENAQRIYVLKEEYLKTIDQVIAFLQSKTPTLARQICSMNFLPKLPDSISLMIWNLLSEIWDFRIKPNIWQLCI
jgi:hypothetical protein